LPTGKVDRRALAQRALESDRMPQPDTFRAPETPLQQALANCWAAVLGLERVGLDDNFYGRGGDSLRAVELFSAIEKTLGFKLPWTTIYHASTLEELAACVQEDPAALARASWIEPLRPAGATPPFFMVAYPGAAPLIVSRMADLLGSDQVFYGFKYGTDATIKIVAERLFQEVRRVQPTGPYHLGGLSYGGLVAFETARRLVACGEQVGLLALFDANGPGYPRVVHSRLERAKRIIQKTGRLPYGDAVRFLCGYGKMFLRHHPIWPARSRATLEPAPPRRPAFLRQERESYQTSMGVFSGRMLLFKARERPFDALRYSYDDPYNGWEPFVQGGIDVIVIPGDHDALVHGKNADFATLLLRERLRQAYAGTCGVRRGCVTS
jgi:thioesterase domain-containing protein/acyl carrier protein